MDLTAERDRLLQEVQQIEHRIILGTQELQGLRERAQQLKGAIWMLTRQLDEPPAPPPETPPAPPETPPP